MRTQYYCLQSLSIVLSLIYSLPACLRTPRLIEFKQTSQDFLTNIGTVANSIFGGKYWLNDKHKHQLMLSF